MPPTYFDNAEALALLIVEDRLLGDDLAVTLEEIGYRVILSQDGEAITPSLPSSPDLVVIDATGSEAIDVGGRLGQLLERPVVYLVDDEDQACRVDRQTGGAPFVVWPFHRGALSSVLQRALSNAKNRSTA